MFNLTFLDCFCDLILYDVSFCITFHDSSSAVIHMKHSVRCFIVACTCSFAYGIACPDLHCDRPVPATAPASTRLDRSVIHICVVSTFYCVMFFVLFDLVTSNRSHAFCDFIYGFSNPNPTWLFLAQAF